MTRRGWIAALPWLVFTGCAQRSDPDAADCPPAAADAAVEPGPRATLGVEVSPPPATADGPTQAQWREPTAAVRDLVSSPPTPIPWVDPQGRSILLGHAPAMPPLSEVARPFAALAGERIDSRRGSTRRVRSLHGLSVLSIDGGDERWVVPIGDAQIAAPSWSPDGAHVAWLSLADDHVELWVAAKDGSGARRLLDVVDVLAPAYRWVGHDALLVLEARREGAAPPAPRVPAGPMIELANGERAQNRTWQDLLRNAHDADLFEYFASSGLSRVSLTGAKTSLSELGMFTDVEASPDGRYVLIERIRRPFSYAVPSSRFARVIEVRDAGGHVVATLADDGPAETIPIDGVRTGPRKVQWAPSEPATLVWFEATDGGDPRRPAEDRDRLLRALPPFDAPVEVTRLRHRARGLRHLEDRASVLATEYDRDRRWLTTWMIALDGATPPSKLFDRSSNDAYGDPGEPVERALPDGGHAVIVQDGAMFLAGEGATPEGDRPFVDRFELTTGTRTRVLESPADASRELVGFAAGPAGARMIVREQSQRVPPNLHLREVDATRALTAWPDPHPQLAGVTRTLLKYRRQDGVELSATLWRPPGEAPAGGWPMLLWAYPLEYNDKDTAGQVRASPNRFLRVTGGSPLALLAAGYAVLDDAAMPVVGDPETMNDTLLQQLTWSAAAAIDAAVATGDIDRRRVAVGGHSYGAFMTANLLAHTDLFAAGIARSGAYNRTLTPFGYQSERRTLWEAKATYVEVSPLMHAEAIDEPLLLVHGELDDNSGTFPLQSQRLFQAIRGNGGVAKLVVLPHEAHGYTARENLLQLLAEEIEWLDTHLANPAADSPVRTEGAGKRGATD
ncbi:MAG: S9 family peptidase [Deltaproteobacteria bacterium]|nr:S9 family peptidase [Deltaproteobacteria bacterium]